MDWEKVFVDWYAEIVIGQKCFDDLVETNLVEKRRKPEQASNSYHATGMWYANSYEIVHSFIQSIWRCNGQVLHKVQYDEDYHGVKLMQLSTGRGKDIHNNVLLNETHILSLLFSSSWCHMLKNSLRWGLPPERSRFSTRSKRIPTFVSLLPLERCLL